ncbi:MAG: hypothetical protein LC778_21155 [Acidobacteria bacterium]|nr:hypothetical protein [Acidobacteriota bacterium]
MSSSQLQRIVEQVRELPAAEQLELIRRVAEHLAQQQTQQASVREPRQLVYGEFRNSGTGRPSTEEDFKLAEWRPTEEELNEY